MFLAQGRFAFVLRRFLLHSGSLDLLAKNDLGAHGKRPGFRFKPELRGVEKLAYIHSDGTLVAAAHYNRTYNSPFNGGLYLLCAASLSVLQHVVSNVNLVCDQPSWKELRAEVQHSGSGPSSRSTYSFSLCTQNYTYVFYMHVFISQSAITVRVVSDMVLV